jgi:hypothetical protein
MRSRAEKKQLLLEFSQKNEVPTVGGAPTQQSRGAKIGAIARVALTSWFAKGVLVVYG